MNVPFKSKEPMYTVREAAVELQLSEDSVRRYCNLLPEPKIVGKKQGRDWLIPLSEIKRYLCERREVGRPPKTA
jgi:hypothetical protein